MFETGNAKLGPGGYMKEVYELDVYQLAEDLSDLIWYAFDELGSKLNAFIRSTRLDASPK
jgi:hypothetical protein